MFSKLKNHIQSRINISNEELKEIFSLCSVFDYKKDDVIIRRGEYCKIIGFLNKGIIRVNYVNDAGKEVTQQFIYEDCFFTHVEGLTEERKCHCDFQALGDCEVVLLDKVTLHKIVEQDARLNKLFTFHLAEELKNMLIESQVNRSNSSKEKYLRFIEQYPDAFNRIPLKYIASYLGMEPQSLSRIRKRLSRNY